MLNFKQALSNQEGIFRLKSLFMEITMPEWWIDSSLSDFIENRGLVNPTLSILPMTAVRFNGCAVINIKESVNYEGIGPSVGNITSLDGSSLDVSLHALDNKQRKSLEDC
ncbi:MAG: hypothetical protein IIA87_02955 [Nanoarchaeota archaeon]|nr:hypothetical protein [Nanoarchaeota archaeon]